MKLQKSSLAGAVQIANEINAQASYILVYFNNMIDHEKMKSGKFFL